MPPDWVLQQCPDDGSAGSRIVLVFWFVCLPLYWIYLALMMGPAVASLGPAFGQLLYTILVLAAILAGMICLGVVLVLLLALAAAIAGIRQVRRPSE
jgi:hypothetical protein